MKLNDPKMIGRLHRQYLYLREFGFIKFCQHVLRTIYRSRLMVFEGDLSRPIEETKAKLPVTMRILSMKEADIEHLARFWKARSDMPEEKQDVRGLNHQSVIERGPMSGCRI
jgi:hypothetical protein